MTHVNNINTKKEGEMLTTLSTQHNKKHITDH